MRSVRLYGRVPVEDIRTLALDEGSRTSAALAHFVAAAIWRDAEDPTAADWGGRRDSRRRRGAVDRRPRDDDAPGRFEFVWDLGEEWSQWTGLPFVFAMWVARPGLELRDIGETLAAARDEGLRRLAEIARREAPAIGIPEEDCLDYLRDHLKFHFGPRQRRGLERFYALAAEGGLDGARD